MIILHCVTEFDILQISQFPATFENVVICNPVTEHELSFLSLEVCYVLIFVVVSPFYNTEKDCACSLCFNICPVDPVI